MTFVVVLGLIAGSAMISFLCWLGCQLLGQNGRILLRLEALEKRFEELQPTGEHQSAGLALHSPAPDFDLPDLAGRHHSLTEYRGRQALLIFFNPDCGFCRELLPKLASLSEGRAPRAPDQSPTLKDSVLVIISTGDLERNRKLFTEHSLTCPVLHQKDAKVATVYQAMGTPSGYLLDAAGKIASELAVGEEALLALLSVEGTHTSTLVPQPELSGHDHGRESRFRDRSLTRSKIKRDGLKPGTPAPSFSLPRVDATNELSLEGLRGRQVLLVFSSPHCGPCNALASQLEKFHRKHPQLEVVMISRGEPEENREKITEHGLTFPVLLQKHWEISRQYAIFHTPAAYLIDAAGIIAADVAVGAEPILELMTRSGRSLLPNGRAEKTPLLKRTVAWPVLGTASLLQRLLMCVTRAQSRIDTFALKHFKFVPRPDDIFIVTYPRSGTTWMQMILYQLTSDGSMDFEHILERCPWFERSPDSERGFEERPAPRIFKTHLPYRQVPKGPGRYIYVARDGRDVAVSYYNLYRSHNGYKGDFTEFFELFMRGDVMYGSWFKHVGDWWNHRYDLKVLFLTYEELAADLEGCLRRIITFCHLEVPPERLPHIVERCSFQFMKRHEEKFDPAIEALRQQGGRLNLFLRAGHVGEGSRQLRKEQQARFEHALQEHFQSAFDWPVAVSRLQSGPTPALASG